MSQTIENRLGVVQECLSNLAHNLKGVPEPLKQHLQTLQFDIALIRADMKQEELETLPSCPACKIARKQNRCALKRNSSDCLFVVKNIK